MHQKGEIEKLAQGLSMGDPAKVGQEMAWIISFILRGVPEEDRYTALQNVKNKFALMNVAEISSKNAPPSAAIGQAITFFKTIMNGLPYGYVKTVLDTTLKMLG